MNKKVPKHKRVRFKRRDIRSLYTLPSSVGQELHPNVRRGGSSWQARTAKGIMIVLASVTIIFGLGFMALKSGMEGEELTSRARTTLRSLAGEKILADLDGARVSLGTKSLISVDVSNVRLTNKVDGVALGAVEEIRLGLAPLALLAGRLEISSINVDGIKVVAGVSSSSGDGMLTGITDDSGLIGTDKVYNAVFAAVRRAVAAFDERATRQINITNARIDLPLSGEAGVVLIRKLSVNRADIGQVDIEGEVVVAGQAAEISGHVSETSESGLSFEIAMKQLPVKLPDIRIDKETNKLLLPETGLATISLSGQDDGTTADVLSGRVAVTVDDGNGVTTELIDGQFEIEPGSEKIEISHLALKLGRNSANFEGAVGPQPSAEAGEKRIYRFNLVSNSVNLAPAESEEPAVVAAVRVAGTIDQDGRFIIADDLALRTKGGEIIGQMQVYLSPGRTPAVFLAIRVAELPVAHAKQIWPAFAAKGARKWVLENVFGGIVRNSSLEMSVGPGRFGSGIPLTGEEITGHFEVENTRFDVVGDIPPVRDAYGSVDFRGTDVDIALKSGTAYLESDRTVAASNGRMTLRNAHIYPVVADLDIDVAGNADAIADLASHEPINALRHVNILPDDLTGSVEGHITAEIPLSKDRPERNLGWTVNLNYQGVSLASEFDGQNVTNANGSIKVVPDLAILNADADLNGIPAIIEIREPLGTGSGEKIRNIALVFDDKAREKVAPGLRDILSGPVLVKFTGAGEAARVVDADLTDAVIEFPWIVWSKGKGVPAAAKFTLNLKNEQTQIKDLTLSGDTFSIRGNVLLQKGALVEASFEDVQLNRDDAFSVKVKRVSGVYQVDFTGKQFDLRPVIKKYAPASASGFKPATEEPIHLTAALDKVRGFNDRIQTDFRLELRSRGPAIERLDLQSVAASGGATRVGYLFKDGAGSISAASANTGSILGFLDIYKRMKGGSMEAVLASNSGGPMIGEIDIRDFWLVNEPRLGSIAQSRAPNGDGRSLNEVLPTKIDTSRVKFDRGYAFVDKGSTYLKIDRGTVSGPTIGATFDGTLFDSDGQMALNGTFMPAYGLNSALSNIPVLGFVLGNGRDRGLIGVTFRLTGDPKAPNVQINPLSIIAPGIFRSIFEFR